MNVCITSKEAGLDGQFDEHFGRAPYLNIIDVATGNLLQSINNALNLAAVQGAGLETGRVVSEAGVDVVVTGHVGPKASDYLEMAGIRSYTVSAESVKEAFRKFKAGEANLLTHADVRGHGR